MLNIGIKSTKIIPMASQNIKRLEKSLLIICADRKLCMLMLMVTRIAIQKPPPPLSLSLSLKCKLRDSRRSFVKLESSVVSFSMLMIRTLC